MLDNQGNTEFVAFLDECGDHSLTKIDQDFPIFVLSLVLVNRRDYVGKILPGINQLKLSYWDHEGVNFHSSDIRKEYGPFAILQNPERRERFMKALTDLMDTLPYTLFIVCIQKDRLCKLYAHAENPYELALKFVMERIVLWMETNNQLCLPIMAEARGANEDNSLKAAFFDLISNGTEYVFKDRFQSRSFPLQFHNKLKNIAGIQLADLCAHPAARKILKPNQPNRAFDIVHKHLNRDGEKITGWKVFP
jgi:hypothetical protein